MKHVDQAFPQLLGGAEVERTAQPDDTAAGPGGVDAGHDGPRSRSRAGGTSSSPTRWPEDISEAVVTVMPFSLTSGQASGPATRKNTVT